MKKLVKTLIITLIFLMIPSIVFASEKDKSDITPEQYLLFSDIVYNNLDDYAGQKIADFIEKGGVIKKKAKRTYKNKTGSISASKIMKAEIGDFYIDTIFENTKDGFYGAAFKNDKTGNIVLSFRGTSDLYGGINDVQFGLLTINSSQMVDALKLTKDYINANKDTAKIHCTGHSLGGAIALEISHYYDFESETFNAAQMTKTLYYDNYEIYSKVYKGYDSWKHVDHVNEEDFIVGTFEYSLAKKAQKHENASSNNKFFAHAVNHMLKINGDDIEIMQTTAEDYLDDINDISFNIGSGGLVLGSSEANFLKSQKLFNSEDIVYAGDGDDIIEAGGGNDVLVGGRGDDVLDGGAGDDIYVHYDNQGTDTIIDPMGNDTLKLYTSGKITFDENDEYYIINIDNKPVIYLDKVARLDNFSASGEESFTIYDANNKKSYPIELDTPVEELKKVKIKFAGKVDICDLEGNVLKTLDNKPSHISLPNLSAYCDYDNYEQAYAKYVYLSKFDYQLVVHSANDDVAISIDYKDEDGVVAKYFDENVKFKDKFIVKLDGNIPYYINDGVECDFTKTKYTDILPLQVKKTFMLKCEGNKGKIQGIVLPAEENNMEWIEYWSSDESVVSVNQNGEYKALKPGSAIITVELDGYRAMTRMYVFNKAYTIGFFAAITIIIALLILTIALRIRKKIKKSKHKKLDEALILE